MGAFFEDLLATWEEVSQIAFADAAVGLLEFHGDLIALALEEGAGLLPEGSYDLPGPAGHAALHHLFLGALLADGGSPKDLLLRSDLSKDGCLEDGTDSVGNVLRTHLVDTLPSSLRRSQLSAWLVEPL